MKTRITVWCISKYASPPQYGGLTRLFYIAKELCNIGLDVLLITSDADHYSKYPSEGNTYNFENYDDLLHMWIRTYKYSKSASIRRFISWIDFEYKLFRFDRSRHKKPDVVVISSLSLFTVIYGIYLKKIYNCKLVFEVRDIHPLTLTEEYGVSEWNPLVLLMGAIEKIGYKKADLIVGTMPNLKEHVHDILGVDKGVFYSPLGMHEMWSKDPEPSAFIDSLFPENGQFVVGYAGSMGTSNALDAFIDVIKELSAVKDVYFVMVGNGDSKATYIKELSGLPNVKIGPKISPNDIPYFLSKCDLLYLSTHNSKVWRYGQSLNKLIDYMMSAKPIVASYSGYQSMLNEANAGLFIPNRDVDSIVEAIYFFKNMTPAERNLYGSRGKRWVEENHNYKSIALNYYAEIAGLF